MVEPATKPELLVPPGTPLTATVVVRRLQELAAWAEEENHPRLSVKQARCHLRATTWYLMYFNVAETAMAEVFRKSVAACTSMDAGMNIYHCAFECASIVLQEYSRLWDAIAVTEPHASKLARLIDVNVPFNERIFASPWPGATGGIERPTSMSTCRDVLKEGFSRWSEDTASDTRFRFNPALNAKYVKTVRDSLRKAEKAAAGQSAGQPAQTSDAAARKKKQQSDSTQSVSTTAAPAARMTAAGQPRHQLTQLAATMAMEAEEAQIVAEVAAVEEEQAAQDPTYVPAIEEIARSFETSSSSEELDSHDSDEASDDDSDGVRVGPVGNGKGKQKARVRKAPAAGSKRAADDAAAAAASDDESDGSRESDYLRAGPSQQAAKRPLVQAPAPARRSIGKNMANMMDDATVLDAQPIAAIGEKPAGKGKAPARRRAPPSKAAKPADGDSDAASDTEDPNVPVLVCEDSNPTLEQIYALAIKTPHLIAGKQMRKQHDYVIRCVLASKRTLKGYVDLVGEVDVGLSMRKSAARNLGVPLGENMFAGSAQYELYCTSKAIEAATRSIMAYVDAVTEANIGQPKTVALRDSARHAVLEAHVLCVQFLTTFIQQQRIDDKRHGAVFQKWLQRHILMEKKHIRVCDAVRQLVAELTDWCVVGRRHTYPANIHPDSLYVPGAYDRILATLSRLDRFVRDCSAMLSQPELLTIAKQREVDRFTFFDSKNPSQQAAAHLVSVRSMLRGGGICTQGGEQTVPVCAAKAQFYLGKRVIGITSDSDSSDSSDDEAPAGAAQE